MIKDRNFIISGLQRWDINIGSNAKDIALEIAKNNRVLYVNTPEDGVNTPFKITEIVKNRLWTVDTPVKMLPINKLPDGYIFDAVNWINQKRFYSHVKRAITELNFDNSILFIDNDIYRGFYAIDELAPSLSIYYRRDNMVSHYWRNHAPRLEPLLCSKVDCVMSNSQELGDSVKRFAKKIFNIGQGVNLEDYTDYTSPSVVSEFTNFPHPIIGYIGAISSLRLDADLVFTLAKRLPDYSFVMVGGEDSGFQQHKIHSLKNVHFLGRKEPHLVPEYISAFDICINPQLVNEITIGNYPRKIDEYLAIGKPVVATRTSTMQLFDEYVHCCDNADEWLAAFAEIQAGKNKQTVKNLIAFAHTHTWEASVNKIYQHIHQLTTK